jgi:ATP-binding cassette subfamily B protein
MSARPELPRFTWRELGRHGRQAIVRTWAVSPRLLSGFIGLEVVAAVAPLLFVLLVGLVVREAQLVFDGDSGHETVFLVVLLVALLVVSLVVSLVTVARRYVVARLTDELRLRVSTDILAHLSTLDLEFFEDPASQDVLERAARRPGQDLVDFVVTTISVLTQVFQATSLFAVLIYIEPVLTPIVGLLALPWFLFRWHTAKLTYATEREQTTMRRWSGYYARAITTGPFVPTVRLYDLAPVLLGRYTGYLREIMDVNRRLYLRRAIGGAVASTLMTVAGLGLVVWVGLRASRGEVSLQMFGSFMVAANRFQASIRTLVESLAGSLERVLFVSNLEELLEKKSTIRDGSRVPEIHGTIELSDVYFTYPGSDRPVIRGVSLTVAAGKTVALVGPNGCGKTTLTRLIARLHDTDQGAISIDDVDIRELSLASLRRQIAYVGQNPVRFEATVGENIAYGDWERLSKDPDEVRRIAREAGIENMIESLPGGYDTPLGRRFGTFDLSGGQWQKLGVARALAKGAPILILDEPTASMDIRSEVNMYEGLQRLSRGKTTLLISHRFSTVAMADCIYVMDEGRIVERGTHRSLIEAGGMYAAMYALHEEVSKRAESGGTW